MLALQKVHKLQYLQLGLESTAKSNLEHSLPYLVFNECIQVWNAIDFGKWNAASSKRSYVHCVVRVCTQ